MLAHRNNVESSKAIPQSQNIAQIPLACKGFKDGGYYLRRVNQSFAVTVCSDLTADLAPLAQITQRSDSVPHSGQFHRILSGSCQFRLTNIRQRIPASARTLVIGCNSNVIAKVSNCVFVSHDVISPKFS